MHKKTYSGNTFHDSLPSRNKTAPSRGDLCTFYGIGTEEVRKSIETLERMLDQYDDNDSAEKTRGHMSGGQTIQKSRKTDSATAQQHVSCAAASMNSNKSQKTKTDQCQSSGQTTDEDLPPPPPELLRETPSQTINKSIATTRTTTRAPPVVPKRDPETRLSMTLPGTRLSSSSSSSTGLSSQISKDDRESSNESLTQQNCSESGYATSDQDAPHPHRPLHPTNNKRPSSDTQEPLTELQQLQQRISALNVSNKQKNEETNSKQPSPPCQRDKKDEEFPQPPAEFSDYVEYPFPKLLPPKKPLPRRWDCTHGTGGGTMILRSDGTGGLQTHNVNSSSSVTCQIVNGVHPSDGLNNLPPPPTLPKMSKKPVADPLLSLKLPQDNAACNQFETSTTSSTLQRLCSAPVTNDNLSSGASSPSAARSQFLQGGSQSVPDDELYRAYLSETNMNKNYQRHSHSQVQIDATQLPGYQEVPSNCPLWKKSMIEKKNKQLEDDALRNLLEKKQDEERWKDIPEWKRQLIMDKEKRKQEEMAPYEKERQRVEEEMERLQSLPEWKRNLIMKKRGD